MEQSDTWFDDRCYDCFKEHIPIITIDGVIFHDYEFLLLKRNNSPMKGEWWVPGGRMRRGEEFRDTLHRKIFEETGLACSVLRRAGIINQVFPEVHAVTIFYLLESQSDDVVLNGEHSDYKWFLELPKNSHKYLKYMIDRARMRY